MNRVDLIGNLTKDIELEETSNGTSYCKFTIAVQRRFKNENDEYESDFINCVAWRNTAEFISKYFKKGNKIAITGSIQTRTYTTDEGNKRYITEVVADTAEFVQKKEDTNNSDYAPLGCEPTNINDDDLPF